MSDEVIFRDFTKKRKPVRFKLDDEIFECVVAIAIEDLQHVVQVFRDSPDEVGDDVDELSNVAKVMNKMRAAFKVILRDESYETFLMKLKDRENPVDPAQLLEIIQWVVPIYTKDHTAPSLNSSASSPSDGAGTDSTAGAQQVALSPFGLTLPDF